MVMNGMLSGNAETIFAIARRFQFNIIKTEDYHVLAMICGQQFVFGYREIRIQGLRW